MTQCDEAILKYHKLIESNESETQEWAAQLREQLASKRLNSAGVICPVLRPHFIPRRQFTGLVKATETLLSAIDRVKKAALANPALLARMELLPAEKMLASVDPGYPYWAVTSLLDTQVSNGSLYFTQYNADAPAGEALGAELANLYYDLPPVKELRKKFKLSKTGGVKHLLSALLAAYSQFNKRKYPRIAILELRQGFQPTQSGEFQLLAEYFRREGYPAEVVNPEQVEYRNGELRRGDFVIDIIYRRVTVQEFLVRFDLSHPVVRAYRDHKVCIVNSFRSELAHKRAIFALLTDDAVTARFPAGERKAIRDHVPWTRLVAPVKTTYQDQTVDLLDFIIANREQLVLRPNDATAGQHAFDGATSKASAWENALRIALRGSYVVQQRVEVKSVPFPVDLGGEIQIRPMLVDSQPQVYLGKVEGCSCWLSDASGTGYSTLVGAAPTYILESKS